MKPFLNVLKYALLLALSGALMVYAVRGQDLARIGHYIATANYIWLGLTVTLAALGYFSRAYRWQMQLTASRQHVAYWHVYHAMMVGYLANIVLPRMGEVIRCSVLRRTSGVPVEVSLGTVITERVIDVLVLGLLLGTVLLMEFNKFWSFIQSLFVDKYDSLAANREVLLAVAGIAGLLLLVFGYLLFRNLEQLRQNALFIKVVNFIKGLLAGVFSVRKLENKGVFLLHTAFTWLVYYLMDYLAFRCFPETYGLDAKAGLAVLTFGAFGMAAPVSGGIGVFHVMVQSTLLVYGISKEAGIAYALVVHGAQTLLMAVMGGISLVFTGLHSGKTAPRLAPEPVGSNP
ncbi:MAG TPA: lysylphosphatidylglycerol synthase transmembrane domain-containing protein [Hymenobacter sp.]|uniref:lysylphosphatidylglycerol synthase transmembrane domain-containing protein n=1 Tax=Hymenobacter sp. TaxID=1898978 RepID=UPI002EDA0635